MGDDRTKKHFTFDGHIFYTTLNLFRKPMKTYVKHILKILNKYS